MKKVLTFLAIVMMLFLVACDGSTPKANGGDGSSTEIGAPVVVPEASEAISDSLYKSALAVIGLSYNIEDHTDEESYYVGSQLLYKLVTVNGENTYTFGPAANGANLKNGVVWKNSSNPTLDGQSINSEKNSQLQTEFDSFSGKANTSVFVVTVKSDEGNTYKATDTLSLFSSEDDDSGSMRYIVSLDKAYNGITNMTFLCAGTQGNMNGAFVIDGKTYSCTNDQAGETAMAVMTEIMGGGNEGGPEGA